MRKCPECQHSLLDKARFCHECGAKILEEKESLNELFEEVPTKQLEQEISDSFFEHLEDKIKEEQGENLYPTYLERYENSDFKYAFEIKIKQLAEDIQKAREQPDYQPDKTKAMLKKTFHDLSDFFIIYHCSDLNPVTLSEKILLYRDTKKGETDFLQMIEDYLFFIEEEGVTYYTNFIEMPMDRLRKAGKSFLFPEKNEKIFLICDQSVLGSLKEGFAFTEKAIYWRMHFEPARKVTYENLDEIKREKDWITVNGHFFNTNKSLNIKVLKLLKKIKEL